MGTDTRAFSWRSENGLQEEGFVLKEGITQDDVATIAETKAVFRHLKRQKKTYRLLTDILLQLEEDETAVISCCLKRSKFIVWHLCFVRPPLVDIRDGRTWFGYLCVDRNGVYYYPEEKLRQVLLKEGDKVAVLASWKDDQRICREALADMIKSYKDFKQKVQTEDMSKIKFIWKENSNNEKTGL